MKTLHLTSASRSRAMFIRGSHVFGGRNRRSLTPPAPAFMVHPGSSLGETSVSEFEGNTCVVGLQWGDEGKGKIVDFLTEHADVVVRYCGGANAGHTVSIGRRKILHPPAPRRHLSAGCDEPHRQWRRARSRGPLQRDRRIPRPRRRDLAAESAHQLQDPSGDAVSQAGRHRARIQRRRRRDRHHPPRHRPDLRRQDAALHRASASPI